MEDIESLVATHYKLRATDPQRPSSSEADRDGAPNRDVVDQTQSA
jgi:hypothetical protein